MFKDNNIHNEFQIIDTIECLKAIPAAKLIDGMWNNLEFLEFPFVIVSKDRNFFKEYDAFKALRNGDHNMDVDLMIGINHDEGIDVKLDHFICLKAFQGILEHRLYFYC